MQDDYVNCKDHLCSYDASQKDCYKIYKFLSTQIVCKQLHLDGYCMQLNNFPDLKIRFAEGISTLSYGKMY